MWNWESEAAHLGVKIGKNDFFNIGYQITDAICEKGFGQKDAVIWKSKTGEVSHLTYAWLALESSRFSALLRSLGINQGDRVFTYTEKIPELYISVSGILKAGAVVGPLFSSFGSDALRDRLADSGARALIIQSHLLGNITAILDALPELKWVIVIGDMPDNLSSPKTTIQFTDKKFLDFYEYKAFSSESAPVKTSPSDPAVLHYTSGTTGKPKGALHVHEALIGHYATTRHVLGVKQSDIYWCTADIAWVTGMSYGILGPFSNAATQISTEAALRPDLILQLLEEFGVTRLYTAPTLLRMMMREIKDASVIKGLDKLTFIASVGEALNSEVLKWSKEILGLPVHDTWFQTETGCIMLANTIESGAIPGSMGREVTPVQAEILDEAFTPLPAGSIGQLALKPVWPSMFRTYWNNPKTYEARFQNGWYLTGDQAKRDESGQFRFIARNDDVINTAGHLVSPFEVESTLITHPSIDEAAVVGVPDELLGEKIKAFLVSSKGNEGTGQLKIELRSLIRKRVSPFAVPQEFIFVESLPKTESGKIIRRMLKLK